MDLYISAMGTNWLYQKNIYQMNNPLVTIAIPIYNAEQYIRYAIQSCINQTYKNWELLLMCDGSTDNSTSIAIEMASYDQRITVIDDGTNRGLIYRLNQSIRLAKGEYYTRMDADDIMCVTRVEEELKYLIEHPDVDVVGASIMTIDGDNNIIGHGFMEGRVSGFIHPTVMGKIAWFRNNKYCDWAHRAEDFELWNRTFSKSTFYAIGKPLLFYREFGVKQPEKFVATELMAAKITKNYKEYGRTFSWFIKNYFKFILMAFLYKYAPKMGLLDFVVKKRKRTPIPEDYCLTERDLLKSISQ